ncbi:MAG: DUF3137 domain-containing protein [Bacillota bacterium]
MKKIQRLKTTKILSEISIIFGSILALSSGVLLFTTTAHFLYFASGFFGGIILVIIGGAIYAALRTRVYNTLIPTHFNGDIDNLSYNPFHGLSAYQVKNANHLKDPDAFTSQNLFTGSIHQCPFIFSHVTLKEVIDQNTNRTRAYFKGLVIIFDTNHSFKMHTHILTEGHPRAYKNYQKLDIKGDLLDNHFTIYTDNPTRANYILNTYMVEVINTLYKHHPNLNISFIDKKIIITMNDEVNAFSMKLFKSSHLERLEILKKDIITLKSFIVAANIYFKS